MIWNGSSRPLVMYYLSHVLVSDRFYYNAHIKLLVHHLTCFCVLFAQLFCNFTTCHIYLHHKRGHRRRSNESPQAQTLTQFEPWLGKIGPNKKIKVRSLSRISVFLNPLHIVHFFFRRSLSVLIHILTANLCALRTFPDNHFVSTHWFCLLTEKCVVICAIIHPVALNIKVLNNFIFS